MANLSCIHIPIEVFRSSHQRCSMKKCVLKNFTKFTQKHLCQGFFFNQDADLGPATSLKMRLWQRCFPVNFAIFLRTPFLLNTSGGLLLTFLELKGVFRTLSNIWHEAFLRKLLTAFSRWLFLQKCPIVDLRLGSKYASRVVPLYCIGIIRMLV